MNGTLRIMLVVVALGVCANKSLAVMPHVFIGGNVQWNQPTGDFGDAQDDVEESIRQGNAAGVMGGQVDLGLTSNMGQIYAGYRIVDFDERQSNGDVGGATTAVRSRVFVGSFFPHPLRQHSEAV
ncbi:MAG: hypothetical protein IPP40_08320 [bacterium]|nr:hypothetical protein [bacterium]